MHSIDEYDPRDMESLDHDIPEVQKAPCVHDFEVSVGHYNLLDTHTCKKCGYVKFYQGGGGGWIE